MRSGVGNVLLARRRFPGPPVTERGHPVKGDYFDKDALYGLYELRRYLWADRGRVVLGTFLMGGSLAIGLYLPMLSREVFDKALPLKDIRMLLEIGALVFLLGCVEYAMTSGTSLLFRFMALRITARMRTDLFRKLTRTSHTAQRKYLKGDLQDILTHDVSSLRVIYLDKMVQVAMGVVTMAVSMAIMFVLSVPLTLLALASGGVVAACTIMFNRRIHGASKDFVSARSALNTTMFEMLGALLHIKACSAEEREGRRFEDTATRLADADFSSEKVGVWASGVLRTVQGLIPFGIFIYGVVLIIREDLQLGQLVAFSMYFGKVQGSITSLNSLAWRWQRVKPSVQRVLSVLHMPEEDSEDRMPLDGIEYGLEASEVTLAHGGVEVLKGASLVVPKGTMVAVLGPNGSGKTTLLMVLAGLLSPDGGEVLVDGKPLKDLDKSSYRRLCGFVFQNTALLNRSIRETVSYRNDHLLDDREAYEILERVRLKQFVQGLPDGLETEVGEMGSRVSGGEMQRLAVARELAYQPKVLFLDEATTSIDAASEDLLFGVLKEACETSQMSVVFVTHYLSTLRFADLAYVMEDGRVKDSGTPAELGENSRTMRELFGDEEETDAGSSAQRPPETYDAQ